MITSDLASAKTPWKSKSRQKTTLTLSSSSSCNDQLPSLFAASFNNIPRKSKSYATATRSSPSTPVNNGPLIQIKKEEEEEVDKGSTSSSLIPSTPVNSPNKQNITTSTVSSTPSYRVSNLIKTNNDVSSAIPSLFSSAINTGTSSPTKSSTWKTRVTPVGSSSPKAVEHHKVIVPSKPPSSSASADPILTSATKMTMSTTPPSTPTRTTKSTQDRNKAHAASTAAVATTTSSKKRSVSLPVQSKSLTNEIRSTPVVSTRTPPTTTTTNEHLLQVSSPVRGSCDTGRYLGSPRPKSPQKNPKVVSVFHKYPKSPLVQSAVVDPNMLQQRPDQKAPLSSSSSWDKDKDSSPSSHVTTRTTPPLTPLSPEEQAVLVRSLPLLFNVERIEKIDISKTQSVLDKLKQAEYDNESVSSEAERCCRRDNQTSPRQERVMIRSATNNDNDNDDNEKKIQDKLQHFWSNHRGLEHGNSSDDDNDGLTIYSAESSDDDSGLFRY
jgi:hypothetical protein